jgi:hypothetical protein
MCEPLSEPSSNSSGVRMGLWWLGKLVPYSFMPPLAKSKHHAAKIAKSGLTISSIELKQSLGDLYSIPSDARIPLAFERNDLRLKCTTEEIQKYLEQVQKFFEDLSRVNGAFLVKD